MRKVKTFSPQENYFEFLTKYLTFCKEIQNYKIEL
jgi:hypothetical protein